MIKNKLGKIKRLINEYKGSSGVSDTEMDSMYDITDVTLEEKNKLVANKGTVRILNDNMASMYNMLKNK
jgi:hypothetical protein